MGAVELDHHYAGLSSASNMYTVSDILVEPGFMPSTTKELRREEMRQNLDFPDNKYIHDAYITGTKYFAYLKSCHGCVTYFNVRHALSCVRRSSEKKT